MLKDVYTTYQISRFCRVDIATVTNWIDEGKLKAYKTPGGHRRIQKKDFLQFLQRYTMPVPAEIKTDRLRVLVVDDEKYVVEIIVRALKKSGYNFEIESAFDGFEAGIKAANLLPDMVILDINLPGVDGYKVLKDIRSNEELKDIKVLAISGKSIPETREKILKYGADDFIAKPFNIKVIISAVAELLELPKPAYEASSGKK